MLNIITPPFSFVNKTFNTATCGMIQPPTLLIYDQSDIAFSFILEGTQSEIDSVMELPPADVIFSASIPRVPSRIAEIQKRISPTKLLMYVPWIKRGDGEFNTCFTLSLRVGEIQTIPMAQTFMFIDSPCDTVKLTYYCEEDAYGFFYCNMFLPNTVRISAKITGYQYPEDRTVYVTSEGKTKVLKSVNKKEFEIETNYYPASFHEKMAILLSHDHVIVEGDNMITEAVKTGAYEIEWPDNYKASKASFKMVATPYNWRNDNCNSCGVDECLAVVTVLDVTTEIGVDGIVWYVVHYSVSSDVPVVVEAFNGSWFSPGNVELVGGGYLKYSFDDSFEEPHLIRIMAECATGIFGDPTFYSFGERQCYAPSGITLDEVSESLWVATFNAVIPKPAFNYDYQLLEGTSVVLSNANFYMPGNKLTVMLPNLKPLQQYTFKVRSRCSEEGFSEYVEASFTTSAGSVPAALTLNCSSMSHSGSLEIGVPSTPVFHIAVNVSMSGNVNVVVNDDQAGTNAGYRLYGAKTVTVTTATTLISVPCNFDGGGTSGITNVTIKVFASNGVQLCTNMYSVTE